ncbi:uncharacterized protein LTHEOB_8458 [Lasiodiplodia theobromae]|uniref:uncharacterized protein n=1 Tax=Lasiodiplodia theobromae TaxID=45133 RepID=UPI0015C2F8A0|nr:uncharacterized protein LTHEOB_8458 [Lasiodiplodia theobromae]KAF4541463.1 hypothetical protein LTHEOB_8458 [Lasiodiplodia theobromae]
MLRARPAVDLLVKARPAARMFHQTPKMRSMPKDPHSAHTVSQRIRQGIKAIPVEIYPLGKRAQLPSSSSSFHTAANTYRNHHARHVRPTTISEAISREQEIAEYVECATVAVIACGLSFGVYSFIRPAREDPTLRLHRRGPEH